MWQDGWCPSRGTGHRRAGGTPAVLRADLPVHGVSKGAATLRGASLSPGTSTSAPDAKPPPPRPQTTKPHFVLVPGAAV